VVAARPRVATAEAVVADLIGRRERRAEDRISAAERQAIADMRAQAASLATAAAERLIRDGYDKKTDKALVDRTIAELGQR
jgi:F-type H+-transporting ATPase subunit b